MGFLSRLFGSSDPMTSIRKAVASCSWAEALAIGQGIDRSQIADHQVAELEELLDVSSNALAELNITEGRACLYAGDMSRAREHLELAVKYAKASDVLDKANLLQVDVCSSSQAGAGEANSKSCGSGSCCDPSMENRESVDDGEIDRSSRLELLLSGFPVAWRDRYHSLEGSLLQAIFAAHAGANEEAIVCFAQVTEEERDDIYWFERGTLLARMGQHEESCKALETCLCINPDHDLALENLIDIFLLGGQVESAKNYLRAASGRLTPAYYLSRMTFIHIREGEHALALSHAGAAIEKGCREPELIEVAARLHEENGTLDDAERLLSMLSSGGCAGGVNLPLAEFRLRHQRQVEKALDAFRSAAAHDPENPHWGLRIAQSYFLLGRKKEGQELLDAVVYAARDKPLSREEIEMVRTWQTGC